MRLLLDFCLKPTYELLSIRFEREDGEIFESARRKSVAVRPEDGSFQWTVAVRAFALLVLRSSIAQRQGEPPFILEGEKGSLASSLDFAIGKPTSWIVDLFGRDSSGKVWATRIFRRENPERKKPGPVRIQLSQGLRDVGSITILIEGREVESQEDIKKIADVISNDVNACPPQATSIELKNSSEWWQQSWFLECFREEGLAALRQTDLLETLVYEDLALLIREHFEGKELQKIENILDFLYTSVPTHADKYREVSQAELEKLRKFTPEIRCALFPGVAGVLLLVKKLKIGFKVPLSIEVEHLGTRTILDQTAQIDSGLALVLSWGGSVVQYDRLRREKFVPLMTLPRTSVKLMVPNGSEQLPVEILLSGDSVGYPELYLKELTKLVPELNSLPTVSASIAEIVKRCGSDGTAGILGFPYWALTARIRGAQPFGESHNLSRIGDNILWVSEKLKNECGVELQRAIRSAWLQLLEQPEEIEELIEELFASSSSLPRALSRFGGLYQYEFPDPSPHS